MQTLKEFKNGMNETILEFTDEQLEEIYNLVRIENDMDQYYIENEIDPDNEELYMDMNLHCVIESIFDFTTNTDDIIKHLKNIDLYYFKEDNIFSAVRSY